jgi:hypothetical protein
MCCRYCSISSFEIAGGNPSEITARPFEVSAELVYSDGSESGHGADALLCEDPVPRTAAGSGGGPSAAPSWWSWGSAPSPAPAPAPVGSEAADATGSADTQKDLTPARIFENKIVLAKRGNCMFEDKALVAARNGAKGVIIYNYEDALFIMAGKQEGGAATRPEEENKLLREFPAVMLTKADAETVIKMMRWLRRQNLQPVYEMVVTSTPMSLDLPSMGSIIYPKVHVKDKVIVVYSREEWGVVLTNAAVVGQEWQLFVLRRADLGALTPWKLKSPGGMDMSGTPQFAHNPVDLYSRVLSRKCPSFLVVDPDHPNTISLRKPAKKTTASVTGSVLM